jgi:hypothetical protein
MKTWLFLDPMSILIMRFWRPDVKKKSLGELVKLKKRDKLPNLSWINNQKKVRIRRTIRKKRKIRKKANKLKKSLKKSSRKLKKSLLRSNARKT